MVCGEPTHWNKDASKGCRWIAFRDLLVARYIANAIDQVSETSDMRGTSTSGPQGQFGEGVVYRHVDTGEKRVRFVCIERNLVHTVGVDRQSGFEQLQPCPEYWEIAA